MVKDIRQTEEHATEQQARLLRIKYFDGRTLTEVPIYQGILSVEDMRNDYVVIINMDDHRILFGITTKTPQQKLREYRTRYGSYQIGFVLISNSTFKRFMDVYDPPAKVHYENISIKPDESTKNVETVSAILANTTADTIFNYIVRQAHVIDASDIHFETHEEQVRMRFRIDGVLHEISHLNYEKYRQLSSAVAIQANISSDSPQPQTGHMHHKVTDDDASTIITEVNMRIETVPTLYGQDMVIRVFQMQENLLKLDRLGLSARATAAIDEVISHPSGLVLSVGPTGSGKTTTLYSMINKLNNPGRKIITLEDPVEFSMHGIVQIPVGSEQRTTFDKVLSSVLRLDPDVIMIGEIRDTDTAKTALQAALSGHLVLSTFHAADAASALARITEFIGENPLFAGAIRMIIAQRLVRRLDPATRQAYTPDEEMMQVVRNCLSELPDGYETPNLEEVTFYKPGTSSESPFGYAGQTAVVELLDVTEELEKMVRRLKQGTSTDDIRKTAQNNGMLTLMQAGLLKAVRGETSLEEIFRVIA